MGDSDDQALDARIRLEPCPFRLNRNGALDSCFDAFALREPASTSLENALKKVFNRGFKVVAKMQLDSHIKSKRVNCPKLNNLIPVKEI